MMLHGIYIGDDPRCKGESAYARKEPSDRMIMMLQFDSIKGNVEGEELCHGWHAFPAKDFVLDARSDAESGGVW